MNKLWVIARKDVREVLRSRSTYVYIVILLLLTILYISNYSTAVSSMKTNGKTAADILIYSQAFLTDITFNMPLWFAVLMCTVFATYAVVIEKSKRSLESLMAAPISLKEIWLGKSLAVTIPSVILALCAYIIAYIVLSIVMVMPNTGTFILPNWLALVSAFILIPVLIFTVVTLVIYLQLVIANPRTANFVFTGCFIVVFFFGSVLSGQGLKLNFSVIYLGIIVICAGIAFIISRSLTRERVLLSSKN